MANFPSTLLPQEDKDGKLTAQEVQKAILDLLDKINQVWALLPSTAGFATTAQLTSGLAVKSPLPQTAAGVGLVYPWMSGAGGAFVLPAGGTWWWWGFNWNTTNTLSWYGGISAGGTTVIAGIGGFYTYGMAERIT
jgi:hypothetical protein